MIQCTQVQTIHMTLDEENLEDIADVKFDELKKVENFQRHKEVGNVEDDKNEVQLVPKGFQEPTEVPSDSPIFDEGVLFIASRNCWS